MAGPSPLPQILDIVPYKGGTPMEGGWKLSSNENPLGCSPLAREAMVEAAQNLATYPDGGATALREAIARKYGLDANRLVCGAGSDEIFQLLARAYLGKGDEIIQTEHAFLVYRLVAQQSGATVIDAPETNLTADIDAMLERVTERTKIVFLANPNNPTGSYVPFDEVKRLHANLPDHVLLVLDGAYAEYVRRNDYASGIELAGEAPNVLVTRTFSKVHGLAALRLGWAYGPESVIDAINRTRGPFNVSAPAMAAGIAAISDDAFVSRSVEMNERGVAHVAGSLETAGYEVFPSVGNFVLVRFASPDQAGEADAYLRARGISVRAMGAYRLPDCLRISIGVDTANDDVVAALKDFAAEHRG
ncbi:MAG: histidinol-phosphate transaminase [Pseudomonadota bacterium]